MKRRNGSTAPMSGWRDEAKGHVPFIWACVVSTVLFCLLCGLADVGDAEDLNAAGMQKAPAAAGQKQDTGTDEGVKAADKARAEQAVVATVNGVAITEGSLRWMMETVVMQNAAERKKPQETKEVREKALNRLIFQELVYQRALREHMTIDEKDVDAEIERIKKNTGGEDAYKKALEKLSRTEEQERGEVKRMLAIQRLYTREISDKVVITEDEVKKEYDRIKDNFVVPASASVVDVVFFLDTGEKGSLEKAERVRQKILADKDRNPMNLVSDGTFVARERTLQEDKNKELFRQAMKLKEGELSSVIESEGNFHVILMKKYSPEKRYTLQQVRPFLERKLRAEAKAKLIEKWDAELRKNARIVVMASGNNE